MARLLVVDDERLYVSQFASVLRKQLQQLLNEPVSLTVKHKVNSGMDAIETERPDILVADMLFPPLGQPDAPPEDHIVLGTELLELARTHGVPVRVALSRGHSRFPDMETQARGAGAQRFYHKTLIGTAGLSIGRIAADIAEQYSGLSPTGGPATTMPTAAPGGEEQGMLFVSHASKDAPVVNDLLDLLQLGLGLKDKQLFCSSAPGMKVPPGEAFVDYIGGQASRSSAAILILSEAYLRSAFCMAELGAIWILAKPQATLVLAPITHHDVGDILGRTHCLSLSDSGDLDDLRDFLSGRIETETQATRKWNTKRDAFLKSLKP